VKYTDSQGFTYEYNIVLLAASIIDYSGTNKDITIPSTVTIDGSFYNVTTIGTKAFSDKQLTSAIIPNSITSIGDEAFSSNLLASVDIGDSVTTIVDYAFSDNQLTDVVIPDSVTFIGGFSFSNNQLSSVELPLSVTSISDSAFSGNHLTNVTIPDSVTTIESNAFANNQLNEIFIPDSVHNIGDFAFVNNQLEIIDTDEGNADTLKDLLGFQYKFNENSDAITILREGPPRYDSSVQLENIVAPGDNISFEAISTRKYAFLNDSFSWEQLTPIVQWFKGGELLAGQTDVTLSLTNIQEADAGIYNARVDGIQLPNISVSVEGGTIRFFQTQHR
jgi:hypothetical protein